MNSKLLLSLALVLSGRLFGCSTGQSMDSFGGHGDGEVGVEGMEDISSHIFGIEAQVIGIRKTSAVLKSITVKLIKPLPTALGWIPYETPGEIITIHFDESISKLGSLQVMIGSIVRIDFGYIDNSPNKSWGSNFSWLAVKKNGVFYNKKGRKEDSL